MKENLPFDVRQAQNYMSASNANLRDAYLNGRKEKNAKHRASKKAALSKEEAEAKAQTFDGPKINFRPDKPASLATISRELFSRVAWFSLPLTLTVL